MLRCCCSAGDASCVLARAADKCAGTSDNCAATATKAIVLTKEHKALFPGERKRIEKAGGFVTNGRLQGQPFSQTFCALLFHIVLHRDTASFQCHRCEVDSLALILFDPAACLVYKACNAVMLLSCSSLRLVPCNTAAAS